MKDIFETIILSKQSLEYTCSAYEQFTKTSTFPQTYAFCLQNTDIPTSIQQAYESSKILLELLEFSLKIIPSDISPERYSQMTDVFAMHKWCGVSVVKCAQVCCVEKTVAYKFINTVNKNIRKNLSVLMEHKFAVRDVHNVCKDLHDTNKLMSIYHNVANQCSISATEERMRTVGDIEEIINIVSTDRYYLDFIRSSVEKLKNIPTYGYYYSEIAKAMMETHNRKELVDWLHRYRLKYFSVRKINVLLSKTEDMLGLILFGVNYLFIKDGFYIVPKSDWRMSINQ